MSDEPKDEPKEELEAAPPIDTAQATIETLLKECEKLSEKSKESEKELEDEKEKTEALTAKLIRHHLDPSNYETTPDEDDLKEYARNVFGDRPFTKTFEVVGNNKISFSALTEEEGRHVAKVVEKITETMETNKETVAEYNLFMYKVKMLWHIRKINKITYEFPMNITSYESAKKEYDDRFGGKPDSFLGIMMRLADTYNILINHLSIHMFDENFYKGAGLH